jgi:hypothetical protein
VVIPEFQAAGLKPFSLGATYSRADDWLEKQKPLVGLAWGDDQENRTYRCVHGVKDADSQNLIDTVGYWTPSNNPISIFWSVDGVWDGANTCDRETTGAGVVHARPSPEQIKGAMRYWMGHAQSFALADGHPKFGFEYLPKARNADECAAMGVRAIADVYAERFGVYPENFGKYPDDWKTPVVVTPPVEELPVTETPVEPSFNLKGELWNRRYWIAGFVALLILIVLLIIIF